MSVPIHPDAAVPSLRPSLFGRTIAIAALFFIVLGSSVAWATEAPADNVTDDNQLLLTGADVYSSVCSSCHQPGGAGLSGQFPPLKGNPNVDDTEYMVDVIANGLQGEITVIGETYNGVMPAFATLADDEVDALIAYVQSGFVTPVTEITPVPGPGADSQGSGVAKLAIYAAIAFVIAMIALAFTPRGHAANDRTDFPRLDAWHRTIIIVAAVIFFVVYLPSWALQTGTVAKMGDFGQQSIGVALWMGGLGLVLGALWYAHREDRI